MTLDRSRVFRSNHAAGYQLWKLRSQPVDCPPISDACHASDSTRIGFDLKAEFRGLRRPAADDHQHDSTDQTNPAQHRGERNGLLLFSRRLNWAEIQHLFALGVGDPAISERDDADNDKNDADNSCRLHRFGVTSTL